MTRVLLLGTAAFALLSACAHSPSTETSPRAATASQAPGQAGDMMAMCPMNVPGTQVSATDAANGETLTFTTTDQVAELRSRVHAMAEMRNKHHAAGGMHESMRGGGTGSGKAMGGGMMGDGMMMPPSNATVVDLDKGASITLTPNDPADLQKLQSAARMHAQKMQQNGCGMMGQKQGS
jgi:hypothetical protein